MSTTPQSDRLTFKCEGWTVSVLSDDAFRKFEPDASFGTTWRCDQECHSFLLFEKGSDDCLVALYLYATGWHQAEVYSPALIQTDPNDKWIGIGVFKHDIHDPMWWKTEPAP